MIADQDETGVNSGYVHGMNMNAAEDKFYEEVEASPLSSDVKCTYILSQTMK